MISDEIRIEEDVESKKEGEEDDVGDETHVKLDSTLNSIGCANEDEADNLFAEP